MGRRRASTGSSSVAVETAKGSAVVGDVAKGSADGALEDETTNASRVGVATDDGRFNGVGDGVNHRIHGRSRGRHLLPLVVSSDSGEVPASSFSLVY
jgi:hypothetical protein